jgi:hypothetical protein
VPKRVRAGNFSAGVLEGSRDIHDDKWLALNERIERPCCVGRCMTRPRRG